MSSDLERSLLFQLRAVKLPEPLLQHRFYAGRRFAFDFCWPDWLLALEVDGGSWTGGRHTRGSGFERDCEKSCLAAIAGWRVMHVTTDMVEDGRARVFLERALASPVER